MATTTAGFWIDPSCPWSAMTASCLAEVQRERGVDVRGNAMSLALLNEGNEIPEEWARFTADSWGPVRVLALGRRLHAESRRDVDTVIPEAVEEAGLSAELAELAWVTDTDEAVRLSRKRAMVLAGDDVGSPILSVPGAVDDLVGFYGPIISHPIDGDAAVDLWDAYLTLATTPGFFELKRTRDEELQFT